MEDFRAIDGALAQHDQDESQVAEVHMEYAECDSWPYPTKDIKTNP